MLFSRAQLECCGVEGMSDYGSGTITDWAPRKPAAKAPTTCCSGLRSATAKFPPTSVDPRQVTCVTQGSDPSAYYQQVISNIASIQSATLLFR